MSQAPRLEKPADLGAILGRLSYVLSRREKAMAAVILVLLGIGAILEMVGVGSVPLFVALLSRPEIVLEHPVGAFFARALNVDSGEMLVLWSALGLVALFTLKNAYVGFLTYAQARYAQNRQASISRRLFAAYLRSPYTFHLQRNSAEILRNVNTEVGVLVQKVLLALLQLVMEGLVLVAVFGLLIAVEPLISLTTGLVMGLLSLSFYRVIRRRVLTLAGRDQRYRREVVQALQQGLGGVKEAKVLNREHFFLDVFDRSNYPRAKVVQELTVLSGLPRLALETFAVAGTLLIAALLIGQGRPTEAIVPTMTLLGVAAVRLLPSFNRLLIALTSLRWGQLSLDVVYEDLVLLDHEANERTQLTPRESIDAVPLERSITLSRVHYRYPGSDEDVLREITLEIPCGQAVAFVGASGSGKTTLVDVILGLLPPTDGTVRVDGNDVRMNLAGWQRQIGYIPQSIYLTDDSIARNVAFGIEDDAIDEDRVREALESAQLWETVQELPLGIDTPVGEAGVRLSGGQRQRIGIARALYHQPQVLVMDEATSALDNQTERLLVQALERFRGHLTIIVIAHRLSTVRNCDRLFLLDRGRLAAEGTYGELMANSLEFRSLAGSRA